jgi:hypothetical protein
VEDKFEKKIISWKGNVLSYGGLLLINVVHKQFTDFYDDLSLRSLEYIKVLNITYPEVMVISEVLVNKVEHYLWTESSRRNQVENFKIQNKCLLTKSQRGIFQLWTRFGTIAGLEIHL